MMKDQNIRLVMLIFGILALICKFIFILQYTIFFMFMLYTIMFITLIINL